MLEACKIEAKPPPSPLPSPPSPPSVPCSVDMAWWQERSEGMHLDSVCWNGVGGGLSIYLGVMSTIPPNNAAWEELLAEGIHLCKINKEAELSAQPRMTWFPIRIALGIVFVAAWDFCECVIDIYLSITRVILY